MGNPFFRNKKTAPEKQAQVNKEARGNNEAQFNNEAQSRLEALQAEIRQAREKLEAAENRILKLQNKLDGYQQKETQIAEVMIIAQISAQKIEAEARSRAELLQQNTDEELRRKNKELELLRIKVQLFKQDISERIDQYKSSLERSFDPDEETAFTPTLVTNDKKSSQKLIG
ncbi:MAG TPA: hypothetical protein PKN87_06790 [Syntrophomonadaceae bacterium]|mgnify:CR=1 FL=1|nr:hypothetical protein [Syntrophomonadaceae bacterium]HPR92813.1 hypothetical protein [Syntrophomonadaceae bacterium]